MKRFFLFVLTALIGLFALHSCQKNNLKTQEIIKFDGFSLIDQRLSFDTKESFDNTLAILYEDQSKLDNWEKSIFGFTSQRTQFENLTSVDEKILLNNIEKYKYIFSIIKEEDGEKSMTRNIYNDVIATLVNQDGILQIADKVYRFTHDYFYATHISNIDLLKVMEIDASNPLINETKIERVFIHGVPNGVTSRSIVVGECINQVGKYRTIGRIIREEIFDNDCIIRTKHQREVFGIWWANKTWISVEFSGFFSKINSNCNPSPIVTFSGNTSNSNKSRISLSIPGNDSAWGGCSGQVSPVHNGLYWSEHIAGQKQCDLECQPFTYCQSAGNFPAPCAGVTCPSGQRCVNGRCITVNPPGGGSNTGGSLPCIPNCDPGEICVNGFCVPL